MLVAGLAAMILQEIVQDVARRFTLYGQCNGHFRTYLAGTWLLGILQYKMVERKQELPIISNKICCCLDKGFGPPICVIFWSDDDGCCSVKQSNARSSW